MKIAGAHEIPEARVELVPLIDCVFLLLIFFMCAATMAKVDSAADINLPVATNGAEQKDPKDRGTVNVMLPGSRTIRGEVVTDEKPFMVAGDLLSDLEVQKVIEAKIKETPNLRLYLRADRRVKFTLVRRAMADCAAAGVSDVIFATHLQDLGLQE